MATEADIARLAQDFDRWDELLGLIMRAFAYMDGVIDPPSSAHRLTPANLRDKAEDEVGFIATLDGRLVGCIFAADRDGLFYVGKLAVDDSVRGRGVGRALMLAAECHAIAAGKPVLELQTRIELAGNHATFAKMGFVEFERTAHDGFDRPTSITFRKVLR
ncbi:acetyltransferase (GNAT) family protein [Aminobacter aminovorans]|uniref:Putative acetyltransferase n=1 Tax=Aminobacter aminovorans TaxID=83263 RepID=A0A380WCV2_AMIAI|nr:GNAT family N-acetyltransferase [Aminobacter aminovorans]TCS23707.1 acetyltransferase (GNAT) family protein [Aminobacter aminovorans]SUU86817.1 putative acetyltransferase [Aminobacter aminovorans]